MKLFWDINDSELIYLIKEKNEVAYNLMYKKYLVMISKFVHELGLKGDAKEELIQEGLLQLEIAIHSYDDKYGKSFYSYLKLILERKLYRLNTKNNLYNNRQVNLEDVFDLTPLREEKELYTSSSKINFPNPDDKLIYDEIILGNRTIKSLCEQYGLDTKKVYNKVYAFKKKYKE